MQPRLSLITLGVRDLERARQFYVDGLGWRASSASNDSVVFIQMNGFALGLYGRRALAEDVGVAEGVGGFSGVTLAYNCRSKAEVDEVMGEAVAAGARSVKVPGDAFWGGYSGYFSDLDGYYWEVAWNPGFELDEAGNVRLPA